MREARAVNETIVYVHGIRQHRPGYSDPWFNAMRPHLNRSIPKTEVLWSQKGADLTFLIQELLTGSVNDIGESGQDSRYGFGRIDILRAIDFAIRQGFGE